jgi:hypothetical protein
MLRLDLVLLVLFTSCAPVMWVVAKASRVSAARSRSPAVAERFTSFH